MPPLIWHQAASVAHSRSPKAVLPEARDCIPTLLFVFDKLGLSQSTVQLATEMEGKIIPDTFEFEILIKTFVKLKKPNQALKFYEIAKENQIPLTTESYHGLIQLLPERTKDFYEEMNNTQGLANTEGATAVFFASGLSEHQSPESALEDIRAKKVPATLSVYNALLRRYSESIDPTFGFSLLGEMRQNSVTPTIETYISILRQFSKTKKKANPQEQAVLASSFFAGMKIDKVRPNSESFELLIRYLITLNARKQVLSSIIIMMNSDLAPSRQFYLDTFEYLLEKELKEKGTKRTHLHKIQHYYEQMKNQYGQFPPLHIYTQLIGLFGAEKSLSYVEEIAAEVTASGIPKDESFYCALIHAHGWKSFNTAHGLWIEMTQDPQITLTEKGYVTFIGTCIRHHEITKGFEILEQMKEKGLMQTSHSYRAAINLYGAKGAPLQQIRSCFSQMLENQIIPTVDIFVLYLKAIHEGGARDSAIDEIVFLMEHLYPPTTQAMKACVHIYASRGNIAKALHYFELWTTTRPTDLSLFETMKEYLTNHRRAADWAPLEKQYIEMQKITSASTKSFERALGK